MKAPAFQFYADDFMAGTLDLSQQDVGAYIRLLCHQWNRGSIPVETEKQQRLAGGSVSADVLAKFRLCEDGCLRNDRMEHEREKQAAFREKQRQKGILSGKARTTVEPRLNRGSIPVASRMEPEGNSPSPSPVPPKEHTTPRKRGGMRVNGTIPLDCPAFSEFWRQYPRREAKADAESAWVKHDCASKLPKILSVIRARKPDWLSRDPNFIPLPATWLNRRGWEDEALPAVQKPNPDLDGIRQLT